METGKEFTRLLNNLLRENQQYDTELKNFLDYLKQRNLLNKCFDLSLYDIDQFFDSLVGIKMGVSSTLNALNQVQKELELTRDELRDTGDVLAAEKAQHARWLKLTEENRLYDMMEAQTARQIAMLRDLLAELQKTEDPDRARHLLGQVIIIGTYIKRRSNLIFVGEQRGAISVQELRLCLNESSENISIYGADCKTVIKGEGRLTVGQATQVYDLFEAVVEAELESLRALLISIEVGKWVEIALCVSGAEPLCGLRTRFPDLEWEQDEDGLQYVTLKLERSRGV